MTVTCVQGRCAVIEVTKQWRRKNEIGPLGLGHDRGIYE